VVAEEKSMGMRKEIGILIKRGVQREIFFVIEVVLRVGVFLVEIENDLEG